MQLKSAVPEFCFDLVEQLIEKCKQTIRQVVVILRAFHSLLLLNIPFLYRDGQ